MKLDSYSRYHRRTQYGESTRGSSVQNRWPWNAELYTDRYNPSVSPRVADRRRYEAPFGLVLAMRDKLNGIKDKDGKWITGGIRAHAVRDTTAPKGILRYMDNKGKERGCHVYEIRIDRSIGPKGRLP